MSFEVIFIWRNVGKSNPDPIVDVRLLDIKQRVKQLQVHQAALFHKVLYHMCYNMMQTRAKNAYYIT
jgi:hypothetical protein